MAASTFCVSFYVCFLKLIETCRLCVFYLRIIVLVYWLLLLQCLHGVHGPRYPLSTHSLFSAICRKRTISFRHWPSPCSPIDRKNTQKTCEALQRRHNEGGGVSNHQPHECLLGRLFRHTWKKTSKLRVTGLCVWGIHWWQRASNAGNVSVWWRHDEVPMGAHHHG